ncbi:MAG: DUF4197 domain-containing protein [Campylobacterota bacterium]|nr:DUF4197 domain-containing protein [Campylobacterota bacterium]
MIKLKKRYILPIAIVSTISTNSFAFSFQDVLNTTVETVNKATSNNNSMDITNLKESTVTQGLKEALRVGAKYSVEILSKKNGYLDNKDVKIKLPNNLRKADKVIRKVGGDKIIDDLILSMNNAATQAAPKTIDIFINAIEKISIKDSKKLLAGDNDAITKYFQQNTTTSLTKLIQPIIKTSMEKNNVAKYYDTFNDFYKSNLKGYIENNSMMQVANNYGLGNFIPKESDIKLEEYVTQEAISGLFKTIEKKEKDIRTKASSQTTSLLKKVFGK